MSPTRSRFTAMALALVTVLALTTPPVALAQDPMAESFCALFTPEEVGDIIGEAVVANTDLDSCSWSSAEPGGVFVFVSAGWADHTIDERMEIESGTELTIEGRRAYWAPDYEELYIELDPGVLVLTGGAKKELTKLGKLAVSRAALLSAPSTPGPEPSVAAGDAVLAALFPGSIGGTSVTVDPVPGDLFFSDPELRQEADDALAEQGRTFDDVSAATALSAEPLYSIIALRVAGGDASFVVPIVLSMSEGLEQNPGEIAGKEVTLLSTSEGSGAAYASGEVAWIIQAAEPTLTEIISALP